MVPALRLVRILVSAIICIILFVGLYGVLTVLNSGHLDGLADAGRAFVWHVALAAPRFLFYGAIPVAAVGFGIDRLGFSSLPVQAVLWAAVGLVLIGVTPTRHDASAAMAGALSGSVYWLLAGRVAGRAGASLSWFGTITRRTLNVIGYAGLAYFAYVVLDLAVVGGKMLWVTAFEPSPGTPPFATRFDRHMTARMKVAMMDFPDPGSCLESGSREGGKEDLTRLDWDGIDTSEEATVCVFRLLAASGDISRSREWLQAQGPQVRRRDPYVQTDGTLLMSGIWPIREYGPRFPTHGPIRRAYYSLAHNMWVQATWSPDGKTLLGVGVSSDLP
jgi:hypothetical protein